MRISPPAKFTDEASSTTQTVLSQPLASSVSSCPSSRLERSTDVIRDSSFSTINTRVLIGKDVVNNAKENKPMQSNESNAQSSSAKECCLVQAEQGVGNTSPNLLLHVSNLPSHTTHTALKQFFNGSMLQRGLREDATHIPVVKVYVLPASSLGTRDDSHRPTACTEAIVEFATPQDCSKGLKLNRSSFFGHTMHVERPLNYVGCSLDDSSDYSDDGYSLESTLLKCQNPLERLLQEELVKTRSDLQSVQSQLQSSVIQHRHEKSQLQLQLEQAKKEIAMLQQQPKKVLELQHPPQPQTTARFLTE